MTDTIGAERAAVPPAPDAAAGERRSLVQRAAAAPLRWHLLAYALLLLILLPLARPTVATPDEGAYGIEARLVAHGHWAVPEPLARFDPDSRHFPITLSVEAGDHWYAYLKHPVVPTVSAALVRLFGIDVGLLVMPLAGALAAAAVAWLLAREVDPARAPTAFWLAAASPLIFNAYILWAHTMTAAVAGLALLVAVRGARRGWTPLRWFGLGAWLACGVLLRSELVLFALAVLAVAALVRWRSTRRIASVVAFGVPAGIVAAAMLAERAWVTHITGGGAPKDLTFRGAPGGPSVLEGRFQGAWRAALRGGGAELGDARSLVLPLLVVLVAVIVVRFRAAEGRQVELALVGAAVSFGLLWASAPQATVTGLIPAAPALVIGVALAAWTRTRSGGWPLVGPTVLFGAAVLATQYADGGGFQWGGRFFSPIIVPLAVIAAGGWHTLVAGRPAVARRSTVAAIGALVAVAGLVPVLALGATRGDVEPVYAAVARHASPANVTTSAQLPRLMWREDLAWLVADREEVAGLVQKMADGSVPQVTVVVPADQPASAFRSWRVVDQERLDSVGLRILVLRLRAP